jgi:hypothetical protein
MSTLVVYANGGGDVSSSSTTNATTCYNGANLAAASGTTLTAGTYRASSGPTWNAYIGYLGFDTSALTAESVVSAALFSLYCTNDQIVSTPGQTRIRLHDWGASVDTGDWLTPATAAGKTLLATAENTAISSSARYTFVDVAGAANVNLTGTTRVIVSGGEFEASSPGAGGSAFYAYAVFATSAYSGTTNDPYLTITYEGPPLGQAASTFGFSEAADGAVGARGPAASSFAFATEASGVLAPAGDAASTFGFYSDGLASIGMSAEEWVRFTHVQEVMLRQAFPELYAGGGTSGDSVPLRWPKGRR